VPGAVEDDDRPDKLGLGVGEMQGVVRAQREAEHRQAIERMMNSAEYRGTRVDAKKEALIRRASEEARAEAAQRIQRRQPATRPTIRPVVVGAR